MNANTTVEPWHVKREIQLGHIVTTLCVAVSAIWYVSRMEQRIALIEQQQHMQRERDLRQDSAVAEKFEVVTRQLEKLDGKLDRLIEAKSRRP